MKNVLKEKTASLGKQRASDVIALLVLRAFSDKTATIGGWALEVGRLRKQYLCLCLILFKHLRMPVLQFLVQPDSCAVSCHM